MNHSKLVTLLFVSALSTTIQAEEKRQHGTHVHGIGELNVAVEDALLSIELISPADNIVGFEHAPADDSQHQAIDDTISRLENAEQLFVLPAAAECVVEHVDIDSELLDDDHDHDAEGHDDDEHEKHEHDEDHDDDEDGHEEHSEFHVEYEFNCANPAALTEMEVKLFEQFPLTQELNVQLLSTSGQTQKTLSKADATITL